MAKTVLKYALKYAAYYALFALFSLAENFLSVKGFCVAFLFSLLYCREKIFVILPCFAGGVLTSGITLYGGVTASVGVLSALISYLFHFYYPKIAKKPGKLRFVLPETLILTLIANIPQAVFSSSDLDSVAMTALGTALSLVFHYVGVVAMYPILVRGIRYRLNGNEKFSLLAVITLLSVGLNTLAPFGIKIVFFVSGILLMALRIPEREFIVPTGICIGLGMSILSSPVNIAVLSLTSLVIYALSGQRSFLPAIGGAFAFTLSYYIFVGSLDIFCAAPFFVGVMLSALVPERLYKKTLSGRQGYRERFALRTVVNREREDLSRRLNSVAEALNEMRDILRSEQPFDYTPGAVLKEVCENSCMTCNRLEKCTEKMGDVATNVGKLVCAALDNGRATVLDVGVGLGENCNRINHLVNVTNTEVALFRAKREKRSGLEQGREMVIGQLSGTAQLLNTLSRSVAVNMTFDPEPERKIIEALGRANVISTDVCLYSDGDDPEITIVVREKDVDKPCIREILSDIVGFPVAEYSRARDIMDMASLRFCKAPAYKILYGEAVSSKEKRCGDTRQAVKLNYRKLLFILSDGMGTGASAADTSNKIIELIESFYKAGFDSGTVFSNVAKLISLREKEDFSALDVAILDTQTAEIDFIKQGGRESFVYSGNEVEIISGGSLPMGIVESEPIVEHRRLKPDDIVVLMSDGVADSISPAELTQIMRESPAANPQRVAENIIKDAMRLSGTDRDDMTAIALRVIKIYDNPKN